ncbi:MAG: hypothetical protein NC035_09310 [Bacteroides sp.]|nr:hypothetical protein [Bacteroides sp.]
MRKNVIIDLLEDGESVSLYSVLFKGEQYTEFEKFLLTYKDLPEYENDLGVILARIDKIMEQGAFDRHFRYEGRKSDRLKGLPSSIESSRLRLYCVRVSDSVLILGNGGEKRTRTYQEDDFLNGCVQVLQKIDLEIKIRENKKKITIVGTHIEGELSFYINLDEEL